MHALAYTICKPSAYFLRAGTFCVINNHWCELCQEKMYLSYFCTLYKIQCVQLYTTVTQTSYVTWLGALFLASSMQQMLMPKQLICITCNTICKLQAMLHLNVWLNETFSQLMLKCKTTCPEVT